MGSSGARTEKVIAAFPQLGKLLDTRVGLLSGGQRQTLAAAMVLMRPTKCLLLDEPLAGLAPSTGLAALNALQALQADEGFPMIIAEHRLRLVQPYVRRVIVMREGRIVEDTIEVDRMLDPAWVRNHFGAQFDAASRAVRRQHEQGPQIAAKLPHPEPF